MRTLVIGGTGLIGGAVAVALDRAGHAVVRAARSGGDLTVDIEDLNSIRRMYAELGPVDHVVCAAGRGAWKPWAELEDDDFALGVRSKLLGQIRVVRAGAETVRSSFTLTTGILADQPDERSAVFTTVNRGLQGFAAAVATVIPQRINVVSPPFVEETAPSGRPGLVTQPLAEIAAVYARVVLGDTTGRVYRTRDGDGPL